MKFVPIQIIETPRLILRKLQVSDIPIYYEKLSSKQDISKYMLWETHKDISETIEYVFKKVREYETGKLYKWVITKKGNDELIGIIELLRFHEDDNSCSFAYMIGKEYWKNGYTTEALQYIMKFAFENLEIETIDCDHFKENIASGKVMKKVGMIETGIKIGKYQKNEKSFDAICYKISKNQFWKVNRELM